MTHSQSSLAKQLLFRKAKYLSILPLTTILIACGGGGSDSSDSSDSSDETEGNGGAPQSNVSVFASDVSTAIYEQQPTVVNLAPSVVTSDNSPAALVSVNSLTDTEQCNNYTLGSLNFTVTGNEAGVCVYEYLVQNQDGTTSAEAYAQVAISGAGAPLVSNNNLAALSGVAEVGGEPVTIELLAPDASDGSGKMTLSSNTTTVGSGAVTNVDVIGDKITYQPGSQDSDAGITRIFYSYYDDNGLVRMGTIDIAVSTDTLNRAPTALDWVYVTNDQFKEGQSFTPLREGEEVTVDLTSVPLGLDVSGSLIDDKDPEDQLQLVDVTVFNATVSIPDITDLTNTTFTFKADQTGTYHVSYVISDHKGGFVSRFVEFHVNGTWPNVIVGDNVFAAPLSLEAATVAGYNISGVVAEADRPDGNGYDNVPTYTWGVADLICRARGGRLPTLSEFSSFATQEQNPFIPDDGNDNEMAFDWPVERFYSTSSPTPADPNMILAYAPKEQVFYPVSSGEDGSSEAYLGYLTCIDLTPQSLTITNPFLLMNLPGQQLEATFETAAGNTFDYENPLQWLVSTPVDPSLPAMPNPDVNVDLGEFSGIFNASEKGYINITAIAPGRDLSTSKDIEVINNLLAVDADPTFETFPDQGGTCGRTLVSDEPDWSPNISHDLPLLYVRHDCGDAPEGDNYLESDLDEGREFVRIQPISDSGVSLTANQSYTLQFWVNWETNEDVPFVSIRNDTSGLIDRCYIVNTSDTLDDDLRLISGDGTQGTWNKVACDFTPTKDEHDVSIVFTVQSSLFKLDEILLFPLAN